LLDMCKTSLNLKLATGLNLGLFIDIGEIGYASVHKGYIYITFIGHNGSYFCI